MIRFAIAAFCVACAMPAAHAQAYPSKPVRIMVGASAGGGTDIIARMLAEKFNAAFKGSFVVENRPGASNTIAADLTAKAAPDGHTLLAATDTGQAIAPHLLKLGFDPIKDLTPVALIVTVPNVLVVSPHVRGFAAEGPLPADTAFVRAIRPGADGYDAVVTMYHDQGQIAMKLTGFERGVTVQGGLPIPITAPAHGTAYVIAGKGVARPQAMLNAFALAVRMGASRRAAA
jgi:hypothetical protein